MSQASMFALDVPVPPKAGHYAVQYVDFPWPEHGGGKIQRGADRHYRLMKVRDILDLSRTFGEWAAADAHLYSWVTNNYLPAGLEAITAAGFRYVTTVTWVKSKMGLGQYYRGRTEHCLFAVRGRLPYRIREDNGKRAQGETVIYEPEAYTEDFPPGRDEESYCCDCGHTVGVPCHDDCAKRRQPDPDLPSAFEAPLGRHSAKPEKMRDYIRLVSGGHGPMLECFAREAAPGFDAWGNQAPEAA